jgi:hypothetical protein
MESGKSYLYFVAALVIPKNGEQLIQSTTVEQKYKVTGRTYANFFEDLIKSYSLNLKVPIEQVILLNFFELEND